MARMVCSVCAFRDTKAKSGVCRLCAEYPEAAPVFTDRVLRLEELYERSEKVLVLCGIDPSQEDADDADTLATIDDLSRKGLIYDKLRPDRFRVPVADWEGGVRALLAGGAAPEVAGVPAVPDAGRCRDGGDDPGVRQGAGAVGGDGPAAAGWGRVCHAGGRAGGADGLGLFAAVAERWPSRARFRPWQSVRVKRPGGGVDGEVVGVRLEGGHRVYRVHLASTEVVDAPEYLCAAVPEVGNDDDDGRRACDGGGSVAVSGVPVPSC
jgi:hypothetical protein